jgi:hypothetical protein
MPDGIELLARWRGGLWANLFAQLRYTVEPGDRKPILFHHWEHHFKFLPEDEVRQTAEMWAILPAVVAATDIVQLNRMASGMLYDLAVSLGWRKLTAREKQKAGISLDSPQWQRRDSIALRLAQSQGIKLGVGEYTLRASYNEPRLRGICVQCQEPNEHCGCRRVDG